MSYVCTENRSLWREIIESTRDMSSFGHFYRIQILFLLPIVFSLIVYPFFHLALFHPDYDFTGFSQLQFSNFEIIVPIVYTVFLALFFLPGVATTTYSAVQALYVRPINLVSSIKSIINSFFPLIFTSIVSQTIFMSITFLFALFLELVLEILQSLGLIELQCDSNHSLLLLILALIVLVTFLLWLQVNWSLTYVIPAVESKKDYVTRRRSANLVAFGILLYYGIAIVGMVVYCAMFLVSVGAAKGAKWRSFEVNILQTALTSVRKYVLLCYVLLA